MCEAVEKHRGKALFVLAADRPVIHCLPAAGMLLLRVYKHLILHKKKKKRFQPRVKVRLPRAPEWFLEV